MKIGIEGQRLFRQKKHGMDMVALELVNNLQDIDHYNEYFVFVKPDKDNTCIRKAENFHVVELNGGSYPQWEQFALPKAAREYGCGLLHCTSNTAPLKASMPLVVTVHDMIYMEKFPLFASGFNWYQRLGNTYRRYVVPRVIKKSEKVITVSNYEKKRMSMFFNLDEQRLQAVYNGVSAHFKKIKDQRELERISKKYKLPDRFLFFLGNTDPKKNTPGVLRAYSMFLKQTDDPVPLVMPDYDMKELRRILDDIGDPGLLEHIHLTGYINNSELPGIYNQCEIFLYPSLRESFGIPILEGMACGVPVITSNAASMPEVSGGAAYLVNPMKPQEVVEGIFKIRASESLRNELIEKGLKRSSEFTWKNMAEEVLKIYKSILE